MVLGKGWFAPNSFNAYFDPNKMSMSRTLVWIILLDLPLHFLSTPTLESIGSSIWKFLRVDIEQAKERLATYICICIEADLRLGMIDIIFLNWNQSKWIILLDYENTTFCCHTCQQTCHLQDTFPQAWSVY